MEKARAIERIASERYGDASVLHKTSLAEVIADKLRTNYFLSGAGVPTPRIVEGVADTRVFSNSRKGTGHAVQLHSPGSQLDPNRYNTEFLDSSHKYAGRSYFVALRAVCVGTTPVAFYVRARRTEENNSSVHNKNTPLDPDVLNHFYRTLVLERKSELTSICELSGKALGLGFFAHDILPERETGKMYVTETGFKFGDRGYASRLRSIANSLIFRDQIDDTPVERMADALVAHWRSIQR